MLAVIIVSWNVRDLLRGCLQSLSQDLVAAGFTPAKEGEQARIIVVDSASSDGTLDMVRSEFPQAELIAREDNIGYVKANNLGLRLLGFDDRRPTTNHRPSSIVHRPSSFVWLLNPDTLIHPGATLALLNFMQSHPRCGLCGPKLVNPDGTLQHGAFALPGLTQLLLETQPRLARFRNSRLDGRYSTAQYEGAPFQIGHPLGAAMFARVESIQQAGLLDEGYEMYCEEVDWAIRMKRASWEIWCVPQAIVTHFGGASSSQASERAKRLKWQSRQRYYAKFYPPLKQSIAIRFVPAQFRQQK